MAAAKKSGYVNGKYHPDVNKFLKAIDKAKKADKELEDYIRKLKAKFGQTSKYKDWPKAQQKKFDRLMKKARDLAFDAYKY